MNSKTIIIALFILVSSTVSFGFHDRDFIKNIADNESEYDFGVFTEDYTLAEKLAKNNDSPCVYAVVVKGSCGGCGGYAKELLNNSNTLGAWSRENKIPLLALCASNDDSMDWLFEHVLSKEGIGVPYNFFFDPDGMELICDFWGKGTDYQFFPYLGYDNADWSAEQIVTNRNLGNGTQCIPQYTKNHLNNWVKLGLNRIDNCPVLDPKETLMKSVQTNWWVNGHGWVYSLEEACKLNGHIFGPYILTNLNQDNIRRRCATEITPSDSYINTLYRGYGKYNDLNHTVFWAGQSITGATEDRQDWYHYKTGSKNRFKIKSGGICRGRTDFAYVGIYTSKVKAKKAATAFSSAKTYVYNNLWFPLSSIKSGIVFEVPEGDVYIGFIRPSWTYASDLTIEYNFIFSTTTDSLTSTSTQKETSTPTTSATYSYTPLIESRTIVLQDVLIKEFIQESDFTNDVIVGSFTGEWFIDRDDLLTVKKPYNAEYTDDPFYIYMTARTNSTFVIRGYTGYDSTVSVWTNTVPQVEISESIDMGGFQQTNFVADVSSATSDVSYVVGPQTRVSVPMKSGYVIRIDAMDSTRFDEFDFE